MNELHFHVSVESRDCDGGHGYDDVVFEYGGETGRLAWSAYVALEVKFFGTNPDRGQSMRRETYDGMAHLSFGGPTDEGFRHTTAWQCDRPYCAEEKRYVYDQFAQAAGY